MIRPDTLVESTWEELYKGGQAARRYRNNWIHFTDVQKLGVHPKPSHKDPPGIYFYHCGWLLDNLRFLQYGVLKKYYYVVSLNTKTNGVNLGTIKLGRASRIAEQNGWGAEMDAVYLHPEKYLTESRIRKKLWKKPGAIFYATMDILADPELAARFEFQPKRWLEMLRGIDYLLDPGFGIIAGDEPRQLCVLNRGVIRILDHGENSGRYKTVFGETARDAVLRAGGTPEFRGGSVTGTFTPTGADGKEHTVKVEIHPELMSAKITVDGGVAWRTQTGLGFTSLTQLSREHDASELAWNLRDLVKGAMTRHEAEAAGGGTPTAWTFDEIKDVAKSILRAYQPGYIPMTQTTSDGKRKFVYDISHSGVWAEFILTRDEDDTLLIKISVDLGGVPTKWLEFSYPMKHNSDRAISTKNLLKRLFRVVSASDLEPEQKASVVRRFVGGNQTTA